MTQEAVIQLRSLVVVQTLNHLWLRQVILLQGWAPSSFLFRTFRSFKEHNILFRSFFELLATYETQKNVQLFSVLF